MSTVVAQEEQPISRTYQYRKVMKPMLERKRRARINRCLDELKELLVGALQAEGESVSRLEKADVLELTVRHLHKLRRAQALSEASAGDRFRAGFLQCANEVSKYMASSAGVSSSTIELTVSSRLVSHLDNCIHHIETNSGVIVGPQGGPPQGLPPQQQQELMEMTQGGGNGPYSHHHHPSPNNGLNVITNYTPPTSPVSSPGTMNLHHKGSPPNKMYGYVHPAGPQGHGSMTPGSRSPTNPTSPPHNLSQQPHHHQYHHHQNHPQMMRHLLSPSPAHSHHRGPQGHGHGGPSMSPNSAHFLPPPPPPQSTQLPLSLCMVKGEPISMEEPFDLSSTSVWRPW